ncbi:MAG: hypothetical protein JRH08_09555 [Deltaproteobacteria bacterium]|nr:hypothetical protein [Deltaproteobacteria bacterium]MBW1928171.1 hypothetical protein [Deltaproteobacteria bacterium]MBW2025416.1 hypothetical protein [Deltaproteobacteria bacterium]MBW2125925.1 hypothetical protein [Deltaproteobacteria bacterium]RLB15566.1 MAG: hypothetical protein DRG63_06660 [Deltaproteobacteria bacterium]
MPVNAEKEITTLWRNLHNAQGEICKTFYRWREAALEIAGPDADETEVALKAIRVIGKDIGKSFLPRLNWLKGEEAFLMNLGRALAGIWANEGAITSVEKGEKEGEVFIKCTRDPWPTYAKEYGVPMEEVAQCREKLFQTILEDVSLFFNIPLAIEMLKAIPRGEGMYLFRLYKAE